MKDLTIISHVFFPFDELDTLTQNMTFCVTFLRYYQKKSKKNSESGTLIFFWLNATLSPGTGLG